MVLERRSHLWGVSESEINRGMGESGVHGRSGRVTLPRVNVVVAGCAGRGREDMPRRVERVREGRRIVLHMA